MSHNPVPRPVLGWWLLSTFGSRTHPKNPQLLPLQPERPSSPPAVQAPTAQSPWRASGVSSARSISTHCYLQP